MAKRKIKLAPKLTLPIEACTQTFAFLGKRGSGKTYSAGVFAEELLTAGVQTVVLDPVGTWYGLRLNADGKTKSPFLIYVIGGEYGDVPLSPTAGKLVAAAIVKNTASAVIDVSQMTKGEQRRFTADFVESFFQAKKSCRSPVHLIVEELSLIHI